MECDVKIVPRALVIFLGTLSCAVSITTMLLHRSVGFYELAGEASLGYVRAVRLAAKRPIIIIIIIIRARRAAGRQARFCFVLFRH